MIMKRHGKFNSKSAAAIIILLTAFLIVCRFSHIPSGTNNSQTFFLTSQPDTGALAPALIAKYVPLSEKDIRTLLSKAPIGGGELEALINGIVSRMADVRRGWVMAGVRRWLVNALRFTAAGSGYEYGRDPQILQEAYRYAVIDAVADLKRGDTPLTPAERKTLVNGITDSPEFRRAFTEIYNRLAPAADRTLRIADPPSPGNPGPAASLDMAERAAGPLAAELIKSGRDAYGKIAGEGNKKKGLRISIERLGSIEHIKGIIADPAFLSDEERALAAEFIAFGKGGVFRFWDGLNGPEKRRLIEQLKVVDIEGAEALFQRFIVQGEQGAAVDITKDNLAAPVVCDLTQGDTPDNLNALHVGEEAFRKGKVAILELAGGSGSRLGYDKPKIMYGASQVMNKSLARLRASKIRALAEEYGRPVPWLIMTSDVTHDETIEFFRQHLDADGKYFGKVPREWVKVVRQRVMPQVTDSGEYILSDKNTIFMGGFGHGDARDYVLRQPDAMEFLNGFGAEYVMMVQVDNAFTAGPRSLGYHILSGKGLKPGVEHISKLVIEKERPDENVGMAVILNGKNGLMEYNQVPPRLAYLKYVYALGAERFLLVEDGEAYAMIPLSNFSDMLTQKNIIEPQEIEEWVLKHCISVRQLPDGIRLSFLGKDYEKETLEHHAALWLRLGNINTLIWTLSSFNDAEHPLRQLPVVVQRGKAVDGYQPQTGEYFTKTSGKLKANKFECMAFHGFLVNDVQGAHILVDRTGKGKEAGFAPIKEATGVDTPQRAARILSQYDASLLEQSGWHVAGDASVELTPALAFLDGRYLPHKVGSGGFVGNGSQLYLSGRNTSVGKGLNVGNGAQFIVRVNDEYNPAAGVKIGNNVKAQESVSFVINGGGRLIVDDDVVFRKHDEIVVNDGEVVRISEKYGEDERDNRINTCAYFMADERGRMLGRTLSTDEDRAIWLSAAAAIDAEGSYVVERMPLSQVAQNGNNNNSAPSGNVGHLAGFDDIGLERDEYGIDLHGLLNEATRGTIGLSRQITVDELIRDKARLAGLTRAQRAITLYAIPAWIDTFKELYRAKLKEKTKLSESVIEATVTQAASQIIAHPSSYSTRRGETGPSLYIDALHLNMLELSDNRDGLFIELIKHEGTHIENPDASEEAVNELAPIDNVKLEIKKRTFLATLAGGVTAAVKVGGTSVASGLVNPAGDVYGVNERPTPKTSDEALFAEIWSQIEEEIGIAGSDNVVKIGVASPGPLNEEAGVVETPENIPFRNFPLRTRIEEAFNARYGRRVQVEIKHDAGAASLGEVSLRGTLPHCQNMTFVVWGTGIGNGVIKNGKAHIEDGRADGVGKMIGEIGHLTVRRPDGRYEYRACKEYPKNLSKGEEYFEDRMSGPNLAARLGRDLRELNQAARRGDAAALEMIKEAAREFGRGLAPFVGYWKGRGESFVDNIVIGSGVAKIGDGLTVEIGGKAVPLVAALVKEGLREALPSGMADGVNIHVSKIDYEREFLAFTPEASARGPAVDKDISRMVDEITAKTPISGKYGAAVATSIKREATDLRATLKDLAARQIGEKRAKPVVLLFDTGLDPDVNVTAAIQAGEATVDKYLDGSLIEVRGKGEQLSLGLHRAVKGLTDYTVVTIAGDGTLSAIAGAPVTDPEDVKDLPAIKELGKIMNIKGGGRYLPIIGLYNAALRLASGLDEDNIDNVLRALNSIAWNKEENQPFTMNDIKKGIFIILPKIGPLTGQESEIYKATEQVLRSL